MIEFNGWQAAVDDIFHKHFCCFCFFILRTVIFFFAVPLPITVARFPLPLTFIINDDASSEENRGLSLVDQETHNACFSRCVFVLFVDGNMRDKIQCLMDRRNVII